MTGQEQLSYALDGFVGAVFGYVITAVGALWKVGVLFLALMFVVGVVWYFIHAFRR